MASSPIWKDCLVEVGELCAHKFPLEGGAPLVGSVPGGLRGSSHISGYRFYSDTANATFPLQDSARCGFVRPVRSKWHHRSTPFATARVPFTSGILALLQIQMDLLEPLAPGKVGARVESRSPSLTLRAEVMTGTNGWINCWRC